MNNFLYNLFIHRGIRLLTFIILFISFSIIGVEVSHYFNINDIFTLFFALLITTFFIENHRVSSNWEITGLKFDKLTLRYLIIGALFAIIPMLSFLIIRLNTGFVYNEFVMPNIIDLLYFALLIFLYASFEEILFRGLIFQTLIEKFNSVVVALLISLIFSSAHILNSDFDYISFINTFIVGLLFSFMYLQTKSLWLPISFHFFWNLFQKLLVDANISGNYFDITIVDLLYPENANNMKILNGGYYGPEASIITTLFLIIIFLIVTKIPVDPYQSSLLLKRKYAESAFRHKY